MLLMRLSMNQLSVSDIIYVKDLMAMVSFFLMFLVNLLIIPHMKTTQWDLLYLVSFSTK